MIPAEAFKALDALRAINAEWATEIDLPNEYLSNLFEQFGEEDVLSIVEDMLLYLDAYVCANPLAFSAPEFHDVVHDVLHEYFEGLHAFDTMELNLEADALCRFCEALYFRHVHPPRESGDTFIRKPPNVAVIDAKLAHIRGKPQPDQRTPEWYTFRHNLLTASNAWKAFESQACMNQLIYEKCKPLLQCGQEKEYVNTASPLHWGQKYEPVSRMIYEHLYKTKVADFGCLQHDTHAFLGASPDGINVDPASQRYGRMLEIKNIVNRDITGIPKKEYWIQMQLQMETADLNECDFLETQFVEEGDDDDPRDPPKALMTGTIIYFMKDGRPHYEYEPIGSKPEAWFSEAMERNQAHTWMKTIHWRLESMSCVLVLRNKFWFRHAIRVLDGLWKTVECERNDPAGYEHRAPKRRSPPGAVNASASASAGSIFMQNWLHPPERKCLIDMSCID
uniref:YqaJ viral recombinase domain-containing protein n=1 Tax=viral metagenome TaxID=1070528 RepID=A0A6C0LYZ4_9ZZZZ